MEYSQIILEMLERIKTLEKKVQSLEEAQHAVVLTQEDALLDQVSMKYRSLAAYLLASGESSLVLTYPEIEEILGFSLPDTAHNFMASFWANTTTHSYASSWLGVGYKTKVNLDDRTVRFIRQSKPVAK